MSARHFYRCGDCLGVCTTSEQQRAKVTCGACGGTLEYMGRAQRDRLVKDDLRCPCDARCTGAIGPHCDCKCGGENHGSGLWVEVTIDAGGIPTAKMHDSAKLASQAKTYRALVEQIRAHVDDRYGDVIDQKRRGEYVDRAAYAHYIAGTNLIQQYRKAQEMRSHHGRNARLRELMKKHGVSEPRPTWTDQPAAVWTTEKPALTTRGSQSSLF